MTFPPPLSREKEDALVKKGTKKSLEKLVLHNMTEAVIYARHISRGTADSGELISACWLALRAASNNYCCRHNSGIRFFAFCKQSIRGQISAERKRKLVVRNSEHQALDGVNDFRFEHRSGNEGSFHIHPHQIPLIETTVEPDHSNIESAELLAGLRPAIFSQLNDRERAILILRYNSGFSFTEIGQRIGFSRQSVQKTHAKSMEKLRKALEENKNQLL